jgi:hypothetical protein
MVALLTIEDVRRWLVEHVSIQREIARLEDEMELIERKLDAAKLFVAPELLSEVFGQFAPKAEPSPMPKERWTDLLRGLLEEANRGLTHSELKELVRATPFGAKLGGQDKSYHSALGKLKARGLIWQHGPRFYSHAAFKAAQEKIASGELDDDEPVARNKRSPLQEEFLKIIRESRVAMTSGEIIAEARKLPEMAERIDKNPTQAYNILSRLVQRGDVKKTGRLFSLPETNEAADDKSSAAPRSQPVNPFADGLHQADSSEPSQEVAHHNIE